MAASSQTPASRAEGRRRGEPTQSTGLDTRAGKLQSFHKSLMVIWETLKPDGEICILLSTQFPEEAEKNYATTHHLLPKQGVSTLDQLSCFIIKNTFNFYIVYYISMTT